METDDGKRGASGIVLSLVESQPGELRLVLDDVQNESGSGCGPWRHHTLFTFKSYSEQGIGNLDLSEKELADIGFHVLSTYLERFVSIPSSSQPAYNKPMHATRRKNPRA